MSLHLALLVFVPGCVVAAWWQINRAAGGNQLSYLYSVLWPAFGILSVYFWWMLIHTDYDNVGLKGMQRQQAMAAAGHQDPPAPPIKDTSTPTPVSVDEDPALTAYNARLAGLANQGPKTWRNRETVVVRHEQ